MKRIDPKKEHHSLSDVLTFAKSATVLIHSPPGEDFVLESADEFDREVAALGANEEFASFLEARSKEAADIPLREARQQRRMQTVPTAAELLRTAKTPHRCSQRDSELLALLARGETEIEEGKGYDLDAVLAEADALLEQLRQWESVSEASEDRR